VTSRRVTLAATAFAGLVGGHLIGYVILARDDVARDLLLSATGHGYLTRLAGLATASALLAIAASAVVGFRRGADAAAPGFGWTAVRLIVLQVIGFGCLEVLERLLSGSSVGGAAAVMAIGVPVQALVAVAGAAVLTMTERVGQAVAEAIRALPRPSPLRRWAQPVDDHRPFLAPAWSLGVIRAPPALHRR
jgi:hypothetical protein